jgi:hypothetical protein
MGKRGSDSGEQREGTKMIKRTGNISISTCALCRQSADLRQSHIVPRFVWDWLKRSSGTGSFRIGLAPNRREQDGFKERLLCGDCERLFSGWETQVAESIFIPIHENGASVIQYGPWLGKFCASISWRTLFLFRQLGLSHLSSDMLSAADSALDAWRSFLLDQNDDPGPFEHHLLPLESIQDSTVPETPPNMNRYFLRTVDLDVACNVNSAFVYAKLCRLMLVGFIQMPKETTWEGTKVDYESGAIRPRSYKLPGEFGQFLIGRANRMAVLQSGISDRQKGKLDQAISSNPDRIAQSESFRAMVYDVRIFGASAFSDEP